MKRHFWQYITDDTGAPLSDVYVHIFLTDQISKATILTSDITENIFTSIPESVYAYIGTTVSQIVDNYNITKVTPVISGSNGYFEFWISDLEDNKTDYRYAYNQKFTLAFVKTGINTDVIENVDIFGIHYEVDETDTTSVLKNKSISNKIITQLESHRTTTYSSAPHGISSVDTEALSTESDYSTKNKLTSNSLEIGQLQHIAKTYTASPHNIAVVNVSASPLEADYSTKNKLTSNQYTKDSKTHRDAVIGVHGVNGYVVGSNDTQTLTNKTITNMTIPLAIADGGTGGITVLEVQDNLGFISDTATLPVSAGGTQYLQSNILFKDDNDATTINIDANLGNIVLLGATGFYNTTPPLSGQSILNTLDIDASDTDVINKVNRIIQILKNYGICG